MIQLADVIATVESANNPHAIRYEFTYKPTSLGKIVAANICSQATAAMIAATSWGMFQIMGDNLYNMLGMTMDVVDYCNSVPAQQEFFQRFLDANHLSSYTVSNLFDGTLNINLLAFATSYNGSGDPNAYAQAMIAAYNKLNV